jgi:signal transduction histidine kinase
MHAWDRWDHVWHWLFLGVLGLTSLLALVDDGEPAGHRLVTLAIAAAFAAWYWLLVVRRRGPMLLYAAGALAFFVALLLRADQYGALVYPLIPQMFVILELRGGIVAVVALNVAVIAAAGDLLHRSGPAWASVGMSIGLSVLIGAFIFAIAEQSAERAELLDENRRLLERARDAGVLEERQRLAREMHDTVAQQLASIVMQLEAAESALAEDGRERAGERVDRARETARAALEELRRAVHALRPAALESAALPDALRRIAERWSADTGVPAVVRVTGTADTLHPDVEVTLLRAAQEGLANVRRHAGARSVTVTLSYMGDVAALDVHDDGRGFEPDRVDGSSTGLDGLRGRAGGLGGSVEVESRPGEGTTLTVTVPAPAVVRGAT